MAENYELDLENDGLSLHTLSLPMGEGAKIKRGRGFFTLRRRPSDFVVEERTYEPGEADPEIATHTYMTITKQRLTTTFACGLVREVVEELLGGTEGPKGRVGYAGLKDRLARTTQGITVPGVVEEDPEILNRRLKAKVEERLGGPQDGYGGLLEINEMYPTRRELKPGDHAGNYFFIKVTGIDPGIGEYLGRAGGHAMIPPTHVPYFDTQRVNWLNLVLGEYLRLGEIEGRPEQAIAYITGEHARMREAHSDIPDTYDIPRICAAILAGQRGGKDPGQIFSESLQPVEPKARRMCMNSLTSRDWNDAAVGRVLELAHDPLSLNYAELGSLAFARADGELDGYRVAVDTFPTRNRPERPPLDRPLSVAADELDIRAKPIEQWGGRYVAEFRFVLPPNCFGSMATKYAMAMAFDAVYGQGH